MFYQYLPQLIMLNKILDFLGTIPQSKILHFTAGLIIFLIVYGIGNLLGFININHARVIALVSVVIIGTWKDWYYDKKFGRKPDCCEMTATDIGGFAGLIISYLL